MAAPELVAVFIYASPSPYKAGQPYRFFSPAASRHLDACWKQSWGDLPDPPGEEELGPGIVGMVVLKKPRQFSLDAGPKTNSEKFWREFAHHVAAEVAQSRLKEGDGDSGAMPWADPSRQAAMRI